MTEILQILAVLFFSSLKYVFGIANALVFDFRFIPSVILTVAGGMLGVYFFAFLDRKILHLWDHLTGKKKVKKVKFNSYRRWLIRFKSRFGLWGIALLTPILLQVPVGTILAMRLIKDIRKVSLYMLASFTFYSVLFCGLYYGLHLDPHMREFLGHFTHHGN